MWVSLFHWLQAGGKQHCGSDRAWVSVSVELMAKVKKGPAAAAVWGSVSKGEAKHHWYPTDTGANKSLLLPAGDQPVPQGISQIKRSSERLRGQGKLGEARTMTHAVSPSIKNGCWMLGHPAVQDMENLADFRFYNKSYISFMPNHFVY